MPKLATAVESVLANIDRYWSEAQLVPDLVVDASKVKQWKCYRDDAGHWRCGPSRFVGYEGMDHIEYVTRKKDSDGGLNGTETENHLKRWTEPVSDKSQLHQELAELVGDYLQKAGVRINKSPSFSVVLPNKLIESKSDEDKERAIVDALMTLSKSLSNNARRSLIRQLEDDL